MAPLDALLNVAMDAGAAAAAGGSIASASSSQQTSPAASSSAMSVKSPSPSAGGSGEVGKARPRLKQAHQKQVLERWFRLNTKPSSSTFVLIARESNLEIGEVKRWFRNRRHFVKLAGAIESGHTADLATGGSPGAGTWAVDDGGDSPSNGSTSTARRASNGGDSGIASRGRREPVLLDSVAKLLLATETAWADLTTQFDTCNMFAGTHGLGEFARLLQAAGVDPASVNLGVLAGLVRMFETRPIYLDALRSVMPGLKAGRFRADFAPAVSTSVLPRYGAMAMPVALPGTPVAHTVHNVSPPPLAAQLLQPQPQQLQPPGQPAPSPQSGTSAFRLHKPMAVRQVASAPGTPQGGNWASPLPGSAPAFNTFGCRTTVSTPRDSLSEHTSPISPPALSPNGLGSGWIPVLHVGLPPATATAAHAGALGFPPYHAHGGAVAATAVVPKQEGR